MSMKNNAHLDPELSLECLEIAMEYYCQQYSRIAEEYEHALRRAAVHENTIAMSGGKFFDKLFYAGALQRILELTEELNELESDYLELLDSNAFRLFVELGHE